MFQLEMKDLLEAGAHFGHQTKRWNPKMKPYIYGVRNSIHIIDLLKRSRSRKRPIVSLEEKIRGGEDVLFFTSARNVRPKILSGEEAERAGMFYVGQAMARRHPRQFPHDQGLPSIA